MNAKYLSILVLIFGLLFTFAQCGRLSKRSADESVDNDASEGGDVDGQDSSDDNEATDEQRAIRAFLAEEDDASQFLDRSSRLFYNQKSHMKDAKKKYEENCEGKLHPRRCPDLATWPAWNQAFASATRRK